MAGIRIAVVEGEADLRQAVVDYLRAQGFDPLACPDAAALDAVLTEGAVEAVLLDLNLPRESGLSIARRLLRLPDRPGILMVAALGGPTDRVAGLELGADDYVGKPFELRELLARLRSVLRRRRAASEAAAPMVLPAVMPEVRFAGYRLIPAQRRLLDGNGKEVGLTPMEFDLLQLLASHPDEVLPRERLLGLAPGREPGPLDRSVDIRITRLRRKLERDPANPRLIRTLRGQGYQFCPNG